jgi:transcriptional regulator GlxA family with amidase domain
MEMTLASSMVAGPFGDVIRQIGLPESNLSHVNRAIGWIRDNYAERMRISDLARLSRTSPSAFHRNFRAITTSPGRDAARLRVGS